MWECDYAGEPVNRRLLFLRFIKKIWLIPIGIFAGILIVSGLYYMSRMVLGEGRTYQAEAVFYIDYADSVNREEYVYFNHYTWNEIIHMDYFVNAIYENCGGEYSKEDIIRSITATLDSDVRFLYVRCKTSDASRSVKLANAAQKAMDGYADQQKEIVSIKPTKVAESAEDSTNLRIPTAMALGALLGFLTSIVALLIYNIADSSVYIPETLEKRYGIPCLGAASMPEFAQNVERFTAEHKSIAIIPAELSRNPVSDVIIGMFGEGAKSFANPVMEAESASALKVSSTVMAVKVGAHNGRQIDRTMDQLKRMDIPVQAFVLTDEDSSLIDRYYKK